MTERIITLRPFLIFFHNTSTSGSSRSLEGIGLKNRINRLLNMYLENSILPQFEHLVPSSTKSTQFYHDDYNHHMIIQSNNNNNNNSTAVLTDIERVRSGIFQLHNHDLTQELNNVINGSDDICIPDEDTVIQWIRFKGYTLRILDTQTSPEEQMEYMKQYALFMRKLCIQVLANILTYRHKEYYTIRCTTSCRLRSIVEDFAPFLLPLLNSMEPSSNRCDFTYRSEVCQPQYSISHHKKTPIFHPIPSDVHMTIISFKDCSYPDLLNTRLVCQYWNNLIMNENAQDLWRNMLDHYLNIHCFFERARHVPMEDSCWFRLFFEYIVPKMKQRLEMKQILDEYMDGDEELSWNRLDRSLYVNTQFDTEECNMLDQPVGASLILLNNGIIPDLPKQLLKDDSLSCMECIAQINMKTFHFGTGKRELLPSQGMLYFFKVASDVSNTNMPCTPILYQGSENSLYRFYSDDIDTTKCLKITKTSEYLACCLEMLDHPKINSLPEDQKDALTRNLNFSQYQNLFCSYSDDWSRKYGEIALMEYVESSGRATVVCPESNVTQLSSVAANSIPLRETPMLSYTPLSFTCLSDAISCTNSDT